MLILKAFDEESATKMFWVDYIRFSPYKFGEVCLHS